MAGAGAMGCGRTKCYQQPAEEEKAISAQDDGSGIAALEMALKYFIH